MNQLLSGYRRCPDNEPIVEARMYEFPNGSDIVLACSKHKDDSDFLKGIPYRVLSPTEIKTIGENLHGY